MINICLCDDNESILELIKEKIDKISDKHNFSCSVTYYSDGNKLLDNLSSSSYDIYFLDIIMPAITGIDIARNIRKNDEKSLIVFLTSSPEYAPESYEVSAENYLLKPIDSDKFEKILLDCISKIHTRATDKLIIKNSNSINSVSYSDIIYIEAMRNKVSVKLVNGESLECYKALNELNTLLKSHQEFIQVHRSYIVNMNYISKLSRKDILLDNSVTIPLSRKNHDEILKNYFDFASNKFNKY